MNTIDFTYDHLTIGDFRTLFQVSASENMFSHLDVIAGCASIDIYALPLREMNDLVRQFGVGLRMYVEKARSICDDTEMPDAVKLLRSLFRESE